MKIHRAYYGRCGNPSEAIRKALFACGIEAPEKVEVPEVMHALSEAGYQITPTVNALPQPADTP